MAEKEDVVAIDVSSSFVFSICILSLYSIFLFFFYLKNPVNSHNEWDLLEEVIIGRVEGATIPEFHVAGKAVWPEEHHDLFRKKTGQLFDTNLIQKASEELDYLTHVLEQEGVTVTRPELLEADFTHSVQTP